MTSFRPTLPLITLSLLTVFCLSLLTACDDGSPQPDANAGPATPTVAQKPARQVQQGLPGIWQPDSNGTLKALILDGDGQLYLVGDNHHRGVSWRKLKDGTLRLNYLDRDDAEQAASDTVTASLDKGALALQGDSPFAGRYRRDNQGIETVTGKVTVPADADLPKQAVLAVTLSDLQAGDQDHAAVVNQRLVRLPADNANAPFRLYFSRARLQSEHRYGISARVIANGAVRLVTAGTQPLPAGTGTAVTLALQSPDQVDSDDKR